MSENRVWNRVGFITCPKLRNGGFFSTFGLFPWSCFNYFLGTRWGGILYIQRNHLGFDLVGWVRVVAFILLFAVNKLEMSLISWGLGASSSPAFHWPWSLDRLLASSVWLKPSVYVAVSCQENNSFVFLLFFKNHGWMTTLPLFLCSCHNNLSKLSLCQVRITC